MLVWTLSGWFMLTATLVSADGVPDDLTTLSIEALMDIKITSVSKKSQKLSDAPAAVFVITQEDIRRSGVTSIAEALRMAPGIEVARITSSQWAITSRGFNGRFANKLLVLIDGRSVYTPLFSGVYWEVQDTLLEDIERIEVIRGPGASLWGANAVNGVINIITKNAADTQGAMVTAGAGNEERGFGSIRYGGKVGNAVHYRVFAKYFDKDEFVDADGDAANDGWDFRRGGFRTDLTPASANRFMLQGEAYDGDLDDTVEQGIYTPPYNIISDIENNFTGYHLLGRWDRDMGSRSNLALQLYFDRVKLSSDEAGFTVETYDVDFQHRFALGDRQDIIWGLGYRFINDNIDNSDIIVVDPDNDQQHLFSGFIQNEISLIEDTLSLILGTKLEHNQYTGFEVQPNVRSLWKPAKNHTLWASAARAVRTPSRGELDGNVRASVLPPDPAIPGGLPVQSIALGDDALDSEELWAYEIGYRSQIRQNLSADIALFYNDYDDLRSAELQLPELEIDPGPAHLIVPTILDNRLRGETYGAEAAVNWQVTNIWRLQGTYTFLKIDLDLDSDSTSPPQQVTRDEESSPQHQFSLRSELDLPGNVELDLWGRYVDSLGAPLDIPSYITLDARIGWKPIPSLEISLVGQNLFDDRHPEFDPEFLGIQATEVEPSVYGKITWRF